MQRGLTPGNPVNQDPGYFSIEERNTNQIDRLPDNLGQAIAHLQQDDILLTALNPQLAKAFLAVRQAEWLAMKDWDLKAEVKTLLEKY